MQISRNTLLTIGIIVLFVVHFYLDYNVDKQFQEHFDDAKAAFFEKVDRIYYINLEHRQDRKDDFLSNFSSVDEYRITRINASYEKGNGALGCLKSHIIALETALDNSNENSDEENILICEDDFYIKDIFYCNRILNYAFTVLPNWNVIMLAHNTHSSEDTVYITDKGEKIIKIKHSATGSGYLMKKSYIPRLLEIFKKDYNNYLKTNEWKSEYCNDVSWVQLQQKDEWYAFVPTIAIQRKSYSDIQGGVVDYGV
jgi:GR25 family glycosyltransferase involved in LPS biosynthesis